MISFIICSISPERVNCLSNNIKQTIGNTPFEIIAFDNRNTKYGITKVYNLCAEKAKFPNLCFLHEDITFHSRNWGETIIEQLKQPQCGCIGFAGCIVKSKSLSSVHSLKDFGIYNYIQSGYKNGDRLFLNNLTTNIDYEPCITLDGMCMFVRNDVWKQHRFDEKTLTGFHGYDLDFSLQIAEHLQNYICNTVILEHSSHGSYSAEWVKATIALHTHKAWNDKLPLYTAKFDLNEMSRNEDESFYLFLKKVLRSNYPYKETYHLIKEYWKESHFQSHSITLLLKLIKIRILHIKD